MFCFVGSLAIKYVSMNNQQRMFRAIFIDLNLDQFHYYLFIINMNSCVVSCNSVEDPFGKICVPNKIEEVNLNVFNMVKEITESKTLKCKCRYEFAGRKYNLRQKQNNDKCQRECQKPKTHGTCGEHHIWNSCKCACKCDKDCEIREYLEGF